MLFFFLWMFFALLVGAVGSSRGHSFWAGFLASAVLSAFFGLILVLVMPGERAEKERKAALAKEWRKRQAMRRNLVHAQMQCMNCGAVNYVGAGYCHHCGTDLPPQPPTPARRVHMPIKRPAKDWRG